MIFILSEENDLTTNMVVEWLRLFDANNIIRVNEKDLFSIKELKIHHDRKKRKLIVYTEHIGEINVYDAIFFWYRRGNITPSFYEQVKRESDEVKEFIVCEWIVAKNYILNILNSGRSLGDFCKSNVNKLAILLFAADSGFLVPDTCISEVSLILKNFSFDNLVISKPISEAVAIGLPDCYIKPFTVDGDSLLLGDVQKKIPSLLQEKIDKWIEIRVFIMYEEIFSMAIFSQGNSQTKTDFRDYDYDLMNRMVPFKLPDDIVRKIHLFMEKAGLDTGSIDLILSKNGEYVFLEVNPAGNIEMVSDTCNYYIEKRIAERIIEEINNEPREN